MQEDFRGVIKPWLLRLEFYECFFTYKKRNKNSYIIVQFLEKLFSRKLEHKIFLSHIKVALFMFKKRK